MEADQENSGVTAWKKTYKQENIKNREKWKASLVYSNVPQWLGKLHE